MEDSVDPFHTKPVVLDLFCGAGGLSLGFKMAGYHIGLGIEKEELPYRTHCYNFGNSCYLGDIHNIAYPAHFIQEHGLRQIDVVIGGTPCQGFS
jgi:DNA (cytosine-5)-methyltransferase 1